MPRVKGYHPPRTPRYAGRLETIKDYIKSYYNAHHYSPGNNEIGSHFGVSNSVASHWLDSLEKEGWIEPREPRVARNIVPVELFQNRIPFPE